MLAPDGDASEFEGAFKKKDTSTTKVPSRHKKEILDNDKEDTVCKFIYLFIITIGFIIFL